MKVRFTYFGMIAESLNKSEETLFLPENKTNVKEFMISVYPELRNMTFSIAINQELRDTRVVGENIDEIALLPPFAGG